MKISIIMPVYNRENYIKQAIDSLVAQDFQDWELILIDDGSTDKTAQIIKDFNDPRIKYYYQENAGEYAATNVGFKKAKSEFITWLHSDDLLAPKSLSNRYELFRKNLECDFIHANIAKIDENGKMLYEIKGSDLSSKEIFSNYCTQYYPSLLQKNIKSWVHHTTFLMKRSLVRSVGAIDEKLKYAGDFDWFLRALKIASKIKHLNKVVYYYRTHAGTRRATEVNGINEEKIIQNILKKYCGNKCLFK